MKSNHITVKRTALVLAAILLTAMFVSACAVPSGQNSSGVNAEEKQKYQITFNTGAADVAVRTVTAAAGEQISAPKEPEYIGYKFGGWLYNGAPFTFNKMPSENISLVAKWNKIYTVSFLSNGGTAVEPLQVAEGERIFAPEAPTREGVEFGAWLLDNRPYYFTVMPSNDLTLTASWKSYITVSFDAGGAAAFDPIIALPGALIRAPESPLRAGYHFLGWCTGSGAELKPFVFSTMPENNITLTAQWGEATVLPALCITLDNGDGTALPIGAVTRTKYVKSIVSVGGQDNGISAAAEFRGRGHGSWDGIKKGYRIKFEAKQALFGFPASRHWSLLPGAWNTPDRTMMRVDIAYGMTREVMNNLAYVARTKPADIYINGEYYGIYTVAEHPRVEKDRLDIESEYAKEDMPESLDTGYLLNYAGGSHMSGANGIAHFGLSNFRRKPGGSNAEQFAIKSPDPDDYSAAGVSEALYRKQTAYIKSYLQQVADALTKTGENEEEIKSLMDIPSFIDNYIIQELYKNKDVGFGGYYLYKTKGGKLFAGPLWDFDWTISETNYQGTPVGDGTVGQDNPFCAYLYGRSWYKKEVAMRWKQVSPKLKAYLSYRYSNAFISDVKNKYAYGRNLTRWSLNLNSRDIASHAPPLAQPAAETRWGTEMAKESSFLISRIAWLDGEWK